MQVNETVSVRFSILTITAPEPKGSRLSQSLISNSSILLVFIKRGREGGMDG